MRKSEFRLLSTLEKSATELEDGDWVGGTRQYGLLDRPFRVSRTEQTQASTPLTRIFGCYGSDTIETMIYRGVRLGTVFVVAPRG